LTFFPSDDYILIMDANFIYKEFGLRLSGARKAAGLTQEALADQVGLNRTSITNIEKGRQRLALHLLFSLASAVGMPPAALLPERKETRAPGVIDEKQIKNEALKKEQKDYIETLVASGITRNKEREDKR